MTGSSGNDGKIVFTSLEAEAAFLAMNDKLVESYERVKALVVELDEAIGEALMAGLQSALVSLLKDHGMTSEAVFEF